MTMEDIAQEDPATTIERLSLANARQQAMIDALVDAADRRLGSPVGNSAFGRWEQNVVLHREVENRTRRIGAAERLLRSVLDSLDGRMCIIGDEGVIIGTNRLWDEYAIELGWSAAESGVGANFFTLMAQVRGELGRPVSEAAQAILDGTAGQSAVKGYLPLIGRGEDIIVRLHPVLGHDDGRVVITMIDISAAVRTERALSRVTDESKLLALVAKHTDNAVVITDSVGQIEWANHAFCRSSGYRSDELIGVPRHSLIDETFLNTPSIEAFFDALASGQGGDTQFPTRTKEGSFYWVHVEAQPIIEDGLPVRYVSVERDITAQRAADERLRVAIRLSWRCGGWWTKRPSWTGWRPIWT
jgi:two-component system NtrC family sensor kinase